MASQTPRPTKNLILSDGEDRKEPCTPCKFQDKKSPAVSACNTCRNYLLCRSCQVKHNQNANTKDHIVVALIDQDSEQITLCTKHLGRSRSFLCVECDQLICDVCIDIEHGDHSLKSIEGITKEIRVAMEPLISSVSDDIDQEIEAIKSSENGIIKKVETHAEGLIAAINSEKDRVVSEIKIYGCTESTTELAKVRSVLGEVLRRGEEALSSKIENIHHYNAILKTKSDLEKAKAENTSFITKLSGKRKSLAMATFVPSKIRIDNLLGDFVVAPADTEEKVFTMKQLERWTIKPCCKVGPVVILPNGCAFLCSRAQSEMTSMQIYTTGNPLREVSCGNVVNLFVTNDRIACVTSSQELFSLPLIDLEKKVGHELSSQVRIDGYFCAKTKKGNNVVVEGLPPNYSGTFFNVKFRKGAFYSTFGISDLAINIGPASFIASTSIGWIKYLDMLLIHDVRIGEVLAYTLEVRNEIKTDSPLTLKYSLEKRSSISSPLPGFYIVEIYCTDNLAYLYLKKGNQDDKTIKAAPVKIYEAQFIDNHWKMTSLKLVKPDGDELCSLENDQQMKIAASDDKLLCLVYNPTPLGKDKESLVPMMDITCYVGSKSSALSQTTHAPSGSPVAGCSSSGPQRK
ncbi:uncharacterized protein LOC135492025 [Lineus longissimus]|uniref:uncharacterized protein LOC135492025 n=1 Tax=Lineus longissimus TaxID=88925 RepID=UPI00315C75B1